MTIIIIIFIAALIQGFMGFGFGMVATPILSFLLIPTEAIPIVYACGAIINVCMFIYFFQHIQFKTVALLSVAGILGTPIGTWLLTHGPIDHVRVALGVIICVSSTLMLVGVKHSLHKNRLVEAAAGLSSGVLGSALNISAPPLVLYYANAKQKPSTLKANLLTYFIALNIFIFPQYYSQGLFTDNVLSTLYTLLPATLIGMGIGLLAARKVNSEQFRNALLIFVGLVGVMLIVTTLL